MTTSYVFAPSLTFLRDPGTSGVVVKVCVADQENLDVAEFEAERFAALAYLRDRRFEVAVDKDEALGGGDDVGRQSLATDIIKIAGDAEGRVILGPSGTLKLSNSLCRSERGNAYQGSKKKTAQRAKEFHWHS